MRIKKVITGPISVNTYICYDDNFEGFIVDPGGDTDKLINEIEKLKVKIKYIILTHGHGDHIGGVNGLKLWDSNIQIVAHSKAKEMLLDANINASKDIFRYEIIVEQDMEVEDNDEIQCGQLHIRILHTPGHTKGGISILVGDTLFSGDTLFANSIGRTDFYGGDFDILSDSIRKKLYVLPDETKVLPGHMGETTIGKEKRGNPFVHN